jgi:ABC-type polysaccharide/polyol phosphate export permease
VLVLLQGILTYGLTLAISALTVRFRDLELILSNLMMVLFFLTPILYPLETIPESVRPFLVLNPMTHLAHSYQNILFLGRWPFWQELAALALMAPTALLVGIAIFETRRWKFAEQV